MSTYLLLKWVHIMSATLMFGTGLGSAFYKWSTDRSGDVRAIAAVMQRVVLTDWLFTTPTVIIQPITGLWMAQLAGFPLDRGWIAWALALYLLAGVCWLPVVRQQIRMRDMARYGAAAAIRPAVPRLAVAGHDRVQCFGRGIFSDGFQTGLTDWQDRGHRYP